MMAAKHNVALFGFVMFILLALLGSGFAPVFNDPDTAWHLATGDLIRAHGLPMHDSWSFTAQNETWYNLSWLFDVFLSQLFSAGGFAAVYTLTVTVFAGSIAFMTSYSVKRGASPLAALIILLPTFNIMCEGVLARPNMCSVPLTLAFYCLLYRYRESGKWRELLPLPFLMALWVNLHGGFLLAFPLIGAFLLEAFLYPPQDSQPAANGLIGSIIERICRNRPARDYGIILALCLTATLINPYGFGIYFGASKTLFAWFDHKYVMEWKPIAIGSNKPFTLWFVIALCVGSIRDKRIAFVDRFLAVALILLSLSSIRHSVISSLLLMSYLSLRLTFLLDASVIAKPLHTRELTLMKMLQKPKVCFASVLLVLFSIWLIYMPIYRNAPSDAARYFPTHRYPAQEAAYVLAHYPTLRFLNHYDIGGYLIYIWRGKQKVFVDGRASSLYSDDLLHDYAEFMDTSGFSLRSHAIADYYRIDGLIMPNDAPNAFNLQWNPEWKIVYRGPVAAIYLRASLAAKEAAVKTPHSHATSTHHQSPTVSSTR
jgi:hypothetical protein